MSSGYCGETEIDIIWQNSNLLFLTSCILHLFSLWKFGKYKIGMTFKVSAWVALSCCIMCLYHESWIDLLGEVVISNKACSVWIICHGARMSRSDVLRIRNLGFKCQDKNKNIQAMINLSAGRQKGVSSCTDTLS